MNRLVATGLRKEVLKMYGTVIVWLILSLICVVHGQNATTASTNVTAEPSEIYLEQCLNESKADRVAVNRLKSGDRRNANDALKKWTLCYLSKQGVMSSAGVLSQDTVLRNFENIDKDKVEQIIDKCLYKNAHDPVETAWHYLTCFYKKGSKYAKKANWL